MEALLRHHPVPVLNSQVEGISPLHDTLLNGHVDIATMLLEHAGECASPVHLNDWPSEFRFFGFQSFLFLNSDFKGGFGQILFLPLCGYGYPCPKLPNHMYGQVCATNLFNQNVSNIVILFVLI